MLSCLYNKYKATKCQTILLQQLDFFFFFQESNLCVLSSSQSVYSVCVFVKVLELHDGCI